MLKEVNDRLLMLGIPDSNIYYISNQWEFVNMMTGTVRHDISLFKLFQNVLGINTTAGMLNASNDELDTLLWARTVDLKVESRKVEFKR